MHLRIILLIVIIIIIALSDISKSVLVLAAAVLSSILLWGDDESMVASDEYEFSKYGNMSLNDARLPTGPVPMPESSNAEKDTSDLVNYITTNTDVDPDYTPIGRIDNKEIIALTGNQDMDERLATEQAINRNKRAMDGYSRSTRNIYDKYFKEELNENQHRVWYSDEAQDMETSWQA